MEAEGVKLDSKALHDYSDELAEYIGETEKNIFEMAGVEFNIASPRQLGEVLFDKLKIDDKPKKTKTGQYSTLYNTIDLLLESGLVRKHQFGQNQAQYEKSYFDKQHDHVILIDTGEVIEFCDPRIQSIQKTLEEVFDIEIKNHSLYFYGNKKTN